MLVVLHHSFPLRLGGCAVGLFFVLSGFWIARMWRNKYQNLPNAHKLFLVNRWWRLAPLFIGVQLVCAVAIACGLPVGNPNALLDWRWCITQLCIAGSAQFDRLLPVTWSLDVEMQFYIVGPMILTAFAALSPRMTWLVALLALSWSVVHLKLGATWESPRLDVFLWLFLLGIICEQNKYKPTKMTVVFCSVAIVAFILLLLSFPATRGLFWRAGTQSISVSVFKVELANLIVMSLGIPLAIASCHRPSAQLDRWFGDISYPLYLFHYIPRDIYYAYVDWAEPVSFNMMLLALNFASSIVGAIILLHFVDRPIQSARPRVFNYLRSHKVLLHFSLGRRSV